MGTPRRVIISEHPRYDWQGDGDRYAWHVGSTQRFARPLPVGSDKSQTGWGTARMLQVLMPLSLALAAPAAMAEATVSSVVVGGASQVDSSIAVVDGLGGGAQARRRMVQKQSALQSRRYDPEFWGIAGGRKKAGRKAKGVAEAPQADAAMLVQLRADSRHNLERCRALLLTLGDADLKELHP